MKSSSEVPMRTKSLQTFALAVVAGLAGCTAMENGAPDSIGDDPELGGSAGNGGAASGGGSSGAGGMPQSGGATSSGGNVLTGGAPSGGGTVATGGAPNTGGTLVAGQSGSGGVSNGGAASGGVGTGGMAGTGGRASGGTATGGKAGTSGSSSGGSATGGKAGAGGSSNGGAGTGGKAGSGGGGTGGTVSCSGPPLTGGTQRCSSNAQGSLNGGYTWTIWSSGTGGCMTPYGVGAAFKANWNNSGDFLARVGLNLGSNRPFTELGTLSADYAQTKTGTAGGYSYIGIYGWSVDPLHEYYIIDDWYGTRPSFAGDKVGSVTVDGSSYDILTHTQVNQPAITGGNATFVQFWSLRTTARQCGHISITEHFRAWAAIGLTLGNMVEAKLLVEAGGGTGSIDFTSATITAQ